MRPGVLDIVELVREQSPSKHAVCESITAIPRHDIRVVPALVLANKRHVVDGFVDLPTPAVVHVSGLWEALSSPDLQLVKTGRMYSPGPLCGHSRRRLGSRLGRRRQLIGRICTPLLRRK